MKTGTLWSAEALTASRIAKYALKASISGGSPTALLLKGVGLTFSPSKQADLEVLGNVARHRDFVGAGAVGEQLSAAHTVGLGFHVPNALFHRQPAHALHVRAFDLPQVDGRVDGFAGVVHDVDLLQPPLAGAGVDFDLGHRSAVAEVVKRLALQGHEVVFDVRRHVKTGHRQADAVQPGLFDEASCHETAVLAPFSML